MIFVKLGVPVGCVLEAAHQQPNAAPFTLKPALKQQKMCDLPDMEERAEILSAHHCFFKLLDKSLLPGKKGNINY